MIGALMMHGLHPGPQLMRDKPELFWGLIASMWVGNLMLVILNLPLVGIWARLLTVPYRFLYPAILLICCIGVYSINNSALDVMIASALRARRLSCSTGCDASRRRCCSGFILGPLIEENMRRALLISHGDPLVFLQRPISATFLALTLALIIVLAAPAIRTARERAFKES